MTRQSPVAAVIFDWAGTAVDFGSMAPVAAFAAAFDAAGVPVFAEEIRAPMGLEKRLHVAHMLRTPALASRWLRVHGRYPGEPDIDALHRAANALLTDILPHHAEPIPGLLEAVEELRSAGIKIGSNSGYSADAMSVLSRAARAHGFAPDCVVSSSDVAAARPAPDLSWACMDRLGLPRDAVAIKVDDTQIGIEEGRNAGLWTVAVAVCGNAIGLSFEAWSRLANSERERLRKRAYESLRASRADYIIDSVADLAPTVRAIEGRIAAGDHPGV